MIPYYYNELPSMPTEEGLIALGAIILGILGVVLLFALVFWIIRAMSLHKIARRRGIRHAWLAWLPIGGQWILGWIFWMTRAWFAARSCVTRNAPSRFIWRWIRTRRIFTAWKCLT